jgi:regulator of cell morphogenesis and NO signaling
MSAKYRLNDKMADAISNDYSLLQVMSRFGMSLGFGDSTIAEVCNKNKVDASTFIAVLNFIQSGYTMVIEELEELSITSLLHYLKESHRYFLEFSLPNIQEKMTKALNPDNKVTEHIMRYYNDFFAEVRKHMMDEEKHVYEYVENLLAGDCCQKMSISTYSQNHVHVDEKLVELKNLIIKYYDAGQNNYLVNSLLYDLFCCEQELEAHSSAEDYLFIPAVVYLENKVCHE